MYLSEMRKKTKAELLDIYKEMTRGMKDLVTIEANNRNQVVKNQIRDMASTLHDNRAKVGNYLRIKHQMSIVDIHREIGLE